MVTGMREGIWFDGRVMMIRVWLVECMCGYGWWPQCVTVCRMWCRRLDMSVVVICIYLFICECAECDRIMGCCVCWDAWFVMWVWGWGCVECEPGVCWVLVGFVFTLGWLGVGSCCPTSCLCSKWLGKFLGRGRNIYHHYSLKREIKLNVIGMKMVMRINDIFVKCWVLILLIVQPMLRRRMGMRN